MMDRAEAEAEVGACTMVVFGASGDLTQRLLLPSLYNLRAARVLPDGFRLLGVAKEAWEDAQFRKHATAALRRFWGSDAEDEIVAWLMERVTYRQAEFEDGRCVEAVRRAMEAEDGAGAGRSCLFYLAVAPRFIGRLSTELARTGLLQEKNGAWRRLVIEKPFGEDLASAQQLNAMLREHLREEQIYRMDHFAGKDAVRELAAFRCEEAASGGWWSREGIEHVQITMMETVGVEERAGYYESAGALRDMVPSHMAEVLSLLAMERPKPCSVARMRTQQTEVLAAVRAIRPEEVRRWAVRAQYGRGEVAGESLAGYREEPGVGPESAVETYVAMRVELECERWAGVPFFLRTGKRLPRAGIEVVVTLREPVRDVLPGAVIAEAGAAPSVWALEPMQNIRLRFRSRLDGAGELSLMFPRTPGPFGEHARGYERLLRDAMRGDRTLFQSAEFVELGWRMVQPLLDAWKSARAEALPLYAAGSAGPEEAEELLRAVGDRWHALDEDA